MKSKYEINGIEFSSKKSIREHFNRIFKNNTSCGFSTRWNEDDEAFLIDFVRKYHRNETKLNESIDYVTHEHNKINGFHPVIVTSLGNRLPIGITKTLTRITESNIQWLDFVSACRASIKDDIKEVKGDSDLVVDHVWPDTFSSILNNFVDYLAKNNIHWSEFTLEDMELGGKVLSEPDKTLFITFHRKFARLRLITNEENMRLGNRER